MVTDRKDQQSQTQCLDCTGLMCAGKFSDGPRNVVFWLLLRLRGIQVVVHNAARRASLRQHTRHLALLISDFIVRRIQHAAAQATNAVAARSPSTQARCGIDVSHGVNFEAASLSPFKCVSN